MAKFDHIDFKPPEAARTEAARGLRWRAEHGRGGTPVGVARARDIKNGKAMSPSTVKRMKAFFDRHAVDRKSKGWKPGEEGFPSAGRIAHALWGGDAGYSFSRKVVRQMEAAEKKKKKRAVSRKERRFVNSTAEPSLSVEYREADGGDPIISGTAIVFNSPSRDLGGFREIIAPTALDAFFARNGDNVDVAALWSHSVSEVLGRTPGTLSLNKNERGLHFILTPPKSRADIVELVSRQDVRGCSFAFTVAKGGESWEETEEGAVRTITEIGELFEISLVLTPAYEATQVGAAKRSLATYRRKQTLEMKKAAEAEARRSEKLEAAGTFAAEMRAFLAQRVS